MTSGQGNEIDFVVRIVNEDKIKRLTDDLEKNRDVVRNLAQAYNEGKISQGFMLQQAQPFAAKIKSITAEIQQLQKAIQSGSGRGMGQGLMQLGFLADDLRFGFGAVVNNIGPLVAGLGAGAGVAGAAQLAAVALAVLSQHVGDLRDVLQGAWLGVPAEELTKMRQRAEEAMEAFDRLSKMRPEAQEKQGKAIEKAIVEGPVEKVLEGAAAGVANDRAMRATPKDVQKDIAAAVAAGRPIGDATAEAMQKANREKAARLIAEARKPGPEGDNARATLKRFAEANPGGFPEGFAGKMEQATPEAQKRQADFEKAAEARKQVQQNIEKADREHARKLEEEIRANKQIAQGRKEVEQERRREKMQGLQDAIEQKQEGLERLKRGMTPKEIEEAENRFTGVAKLRESQVMTTQQMVRNTLTSSLSGNMDQRKVDIATQQLKELKEMKQELRNVGRLRA